MPWVREGHSFVVFNANLLCYSIDLEYLVEYKNIRLRSDDVHGIFFIQSCIVAKACRRHVSASVSAK